VVQVGSGFLQDLHDDHGHVIFQGAGAGKRGDCRQYRVDDLLRGCFRAGAEQLAKTAAAEQFAGMVLGFDNAVGVDKEQVACFQPAL